MKHIIILTSFIGLLNTHVLATDEVDFTKAYLIPNARTSVETTDVPPVLHIGGITTTTVREGENTILNWILSLGFNSENTTFQLLKATHQDDLNPELLQQQLRNTVWTGSYKTVNNLYSTELRFKSIQGGVVGGEIIHTTKGEAEPSSFLHVQVIGDINTQYLIDEQEDDDSELTWVDVNQYEEMVARINETNENKKSQDFVPIPEILHVRHLIRLRRDRAIGKVKHATSRWGSQHEYRLTLENGNLVGSVGSPPESYGTDNALTGIGEIELAPFKPE